MIERAANVKKNLDNQPSRKNSLLTFSCLPCGVIIEVEHAGVTRKGPATEQEMPRCLWGRKPSNVRELDSRQTIST